MTHAQNAEQPLPLPAEITIDIFKLVISVDFDLFSVEGPGTRLTTPLLLGAVCSAWRSFVWETPSLWTTIVLKLSYYRSNNQLEILDFWLGKSAPYPLEIWFTSVYIIEVLRDPDVGSLPIADVHKLADYSPSISALQKIVDQSTRWKRIHIYVMNNVEFVTVLGQVRGKIPLLEAGNVRVDRGFNDTLAMFEDAPLMRSFSINNIDNNCLPLPWAQLTFFHGSNFYEESACILVLSQCTNLAECAFSLVSSGDEISPEEIVSMPHLSSLSITDSEGKSIKAILDCIRCPALRQLHLSGHDWNSEFGLRCPPIEDFVSRSNCALEVLDLGGLYSGYSLNPVLDRLPSLQSLTVGCGWYHSDGDDPVIDESEFFQVFIALLTKLNLASTSGTSDVFLPNLTELHLNVPVRFLSLRLPSPTSQNLLQVLKQRGSPSTTVVSRLRKISIPKTVAFDGTADDEDVTVELNELAQGGMSIYVTFPGEIPDPDDEEAVYDETRAFVVTYPA